MSWPVSKAKSWMPSSKDCGPPLSLILFGALHSVPRTRSDLAIEDLALHQQLANFPLPRPLDTKWSVSASAPPSATTRRLLASRDPPLHRQDSYSLDAHKIRRACPLARERRSRSLDRQASNLERAIGPPACRQPWAVPPGQCESGSMPPTNGPAAPKSGSQRQIHPGERPPRTVHRTSLCTVDTVSTRRNCPSQMR